MKQRIENPRVFISYAWGTEEYNEKVILFATDLKRDGIDVVFDRWQLKEGNDTYAFMEKSVTDESITNVLVLLDPVYAKKADQRSGGVGTETQIISPEVYNKVSQRKFLPVVFERDADGNVCKPRYMAGLLHFDLTKEDSYEAEYQRLVRTLYGIDTLKEPELGKAPAWLEDTPKVTLKSKVSEEFFRGSADLTIKKKKYIEKLGELYSQLEEYEFSEKADAALAYEELLVYRDEILLLLKSADYVIDGCKIFIEGIEAFVTSIRSDYTESALLKRTLCHELFLYTIAYYFKQKDWESLRYILNKTYFTGRSNFNEDDDSFNSFYYYNDSLDRAVCKKDDKNYYSGTAFFWISNINMKICNKQEFVFADLFCYNSSFLISNYNRGWQWFPITYIYCSQDYQSLMKTYANKMKSREHLKDAAYIMGFDSIEEYKKNFSEVEKDIKAGKYREYRYASAFETPQTFWDYITSEELGIKN